MINLRENTIISIEIAIRAIPSIAASSNNVHIVWEDASLSHENGERRDDIFHVRSTDGGVTFSNIINLSGNSGDSRYPAVTSF